MNLAQTPNGFPALAEGATADRASALRTLADLIRDACNQESTALLQLVAFGAECSPDSELRTVVTDVADSARVAGCDPFESARVLAWLADPGSPIVLHFWECITAFKIVSRRSGRNSHQRCAALLLEACYELVGVVRRGLSPDHPDTLPGSHHVYAADDLTDLVKVLRDESAHRGWGAEPSDWSAHLPPAERPSPSGLPANPDAPTLRALHLIHVSRIISTWCDAACENLETEPVTVGDVEQLLGSVREQGAESLRPFLDHPDTVAFEKRFAALRAESRPGLAQSSGAVEEKGNETASAAAC